MTQTVSAPSRRVQLDPDRLAALEEQRDFLLASLTDLEREHGAGDLDDDDYQQLRDDYTARAAEVIRAIGDSRAAFASASGSRRPGRALLWAGGVAVFAILAGVAVAASLGARKPGETSSGGITVAQTSSQRAQQCIPKITSEPPATSIACFKAILDDDPENTVALTWLAWDLSVAAGEAPSVAGAAPAVTPRGASSTVPSPSTAVPGSDDSLAELRTSAARLLDRAVAADPSYSFARAFRAVVAYRNGDGAAARKYLADFRANDPSTEAQSVIAQKQLDAKIAALDPAGS